MSYDGQIVICVIIRCQIIVKQSYNDGQSLLSEGMPQRAHLMVSEELDGDDLLFIRSY